MVWTERYERDGARAELGRTGSWQLRRTRRDLGAGRRDKSNDKERGQEGGVRRPTSVVGTERGREQE